MTLRWLPKDPFDVLDYTLDWSGHLPGSDTIATATWVVPAGLVQDSTSNTGKQSTIWLSGGVAGQIYTISCRVITSVGRKLERSVSLPVAEL